MSKPISEISLCHPERSEGSLAGQRSFAALRMTILHRLRLTRKTSDLKCIGLKGREASVAFAPLTQVRMEPLAQSVALRSREDAPLLMG